MPVSPQESSLIPVGASATAAAALINAVTLPAVAGKTTYLRGFIITAGNVAAVVLGVVTVTGLAVGTQNFQFVETVGAGAVLSVEYPDLMAASAPNTAIVVTLPAIATGGVSAVAVWGFQY